jgi:hypothetical protein
MLFSTIFCPNRNKKTSGMILFWFLGVFVSRGFWNETPSGQFRHQKSQEIEGKDFRARDVG